VVAQARGLGGRFFRGIDVFLTVPKPLVRPVGERPQAGGEQARDEGGLVEPGGEDAVEDDALQVGLIDADRLEVGLVIEATRGVVVTR
jgi:hypothetical protein